MIARMATAGREHVRAHESSVAALVQRLDELAATLLTIDSKIYTARVESHVSGSIGEHLRHCLDHVAVLLAASPADPLTYDHRERGTAIETDPHEGVQQIMRLRLALERWPVAALDTPIAVVSKVSSSGEIDTAWSTLARELTFVLSHTVHHQAIIAVLLLIHGVDVPERFGFAASTPARH